MLEVDVFSTMTNIPFSFLFQLRNLVSFLVTVCSEICSLGTVCSKRFCLISEEHDPHVSAVGDDLPGCPGSVNWIEFGNSCYSWNPMAAVLQEQIASHSHSHGWTQGGGDARCASRLRNRELFNQNATFSHRQTVCDNRRSRPISIDTSYEFLNLTRILRAVEQNDPNIQNGQTYTWYTDIYGIAEGNVYHFRRGQNGPGEKTKTYEKRDWRCAL